MEAIVIVRIVLVALLVIVGIGGFWNMQRMKKKKKALENFSYNQQTTAGADNQPLSPAEEYAKNYILQYKASYPRESLKQALMGVGYSDVDVENWLNKYF